MGVATFLLVDGCTITAFQPNLAFTSFTAYIAKLYVEKHRKIRLKGQFYYFFCTQ